MFNHDMTVEEMDKLFLRKRIDTGYDNFEIVQSLDYGDLKYYDKRFKKEQGISSGLSNKDMNLLSPIGNIVLQEKLRRDNKKVFG